LPATHPFLLSLSKLEKFAFSHSINERSPLTFNVIFRIYILAFIPKRTAGFHENLTHLQPILSSSPCSKFEKIAIFYTKNKFNLLILGIYV
jgi:hypothetical protein